VSECSTTTTTACIALGSNLGDRAGYLRDAIAAVEKLPRTRVVRVARPVETKPVGGPAGQGRYLNAAAVIETGLSARELLDGLLAIEAGLGRERREGQRNEARTIDLDLILFGDLVIDEDGAGGLIVPHPRMHDRAFVLDPLAEIAGDAVHPVLGKTMLELRDALRAQEMMNAGPHPGGAR